MKDSLTGEGEATVNAFKLLDLSCLGKKGVL